MTCECHRTPALELQAGAEISLDIGHRQSPKIAVDRQRSPNLSFPRWSQTATTEPLKPDNSAD